MAEQPVPDIFELRVYNLSPVGAVPTTILIGVLAYGLFLLNVWAIADISAYMNSVDGRGSMRIAFVLTLFLSAAFGVNKFDAVSTVRSGEELTKLLGPIDLWERDPSKRLRSSSLLGFAIGLLFLAALIYLQAGGNVIAFVRSSGLWYVFMTPLLITMLVRGVSASITSAKRLALIVENQLIVDLYRHHQMAIFGRIAIRGAFTWLIFVALGLLAFPEWGFVIIIVPTTIVTLTIAITSFFGTLRPVHRKIRAAKDAELLKIREMLASARQALDDGGSTADIPALVALEDRIEHVPTWPIDLPTAAVLPLYILVPVLTLIAGAFAESIIGSVFF